MLTTYIVLSYVIGLIIAVVACAGEQHEKKEVCVVSAGLWFISPLLLPLIGLTVAVAAAIAIFCLIVVGLFFVGAALFTLPMAYLADKFAFLWKTFWEEPTSNLIRRT